MERGKQEKEKFIKEPSVPYGTPIVFSAQFLLPKLTATLSPGNYILTYILTAQFFTCIQKMFVKTCYLQVGHLQLLFRRASCNSVLKDAQTGLGLTNLLLWPAYTSQL